MARSETYVLIAKIAAELHFASAVTQQLSLTAKNAHAVSARAGQQAAGFRSITGYIEDLASNTISQAATIRENAIDISVMATNRERIRHSLQQFEATLKLAPDAMFIDSLRTPTEKTRADLDTLNEQFRQRLWRLEMQLSETLQQIRAASVISSTAKVEASQAGEFKPQLEVIALNIAHSGDTIRKHLQKAHNLLTSTLETLQGNGSSYESS